MIRDFRDYDGGGTIECDVCIAGAGPAGISMALAMKDGPLRVVVLESGGLDYEDDAQNLAVARSIGRTYHELETTRLRLLGGTSGHWGGMASHLEPHDFERRAWIPHSGWPIGLTDLLPWYEKAQPLLELGPFDYRPAALVPEGTEFLAFDPARLRHKMWHFSRPPTAFGEQYRSDLESASSVEVLLHANLTDIETTPDARQVTGYAIASLAGKRAKVRAQVYVLALGGLENARVLLHADGTMTQGLGNGRDLVGRFFMEHLNANAGEITIVGEDWSPNYDALFKGERQYRAYLIASPDYQAEHAMLGSATGIGPLFRARERSTGYDSLHRLKMAWLRGHLPEHLGQHLWNMVTDVRGLTAAFFERFNPTAFLYTEAEQSPNPDSRVTLGEERDALGMRRLQLDWRLSDLDKHTIKELAALVGTELGRIGAGRLRLADWLQEEGAWPDDPYLAGYHHMGTTRMADDPQFGVADRNCRVFGTDNLYIAGSSLFPTGGCANPTLTLIALALRLVEHLQGQIHRQS